MVSLSFGAQRYGWGAYIPFQPLPKLISPSACLNSNTNRSDKVIFFIQLSVAERKMQLNHLDPGWVD